MKMIRLFCVCFPVLVSGPNLRGQPSAGNVLWTFDIGAKIVSSPALASDGTVYVGSQTSLLAVTNNGSTASNRWTFPAGVADSVAIGDDGTIYFVGGLSNSLIAVRPDGSEKWNFFAGGGGGTPAIGLDNTVYFQSYTGLCAVSPSGTFKWKAAYGASGNFVSPAIGSDRTIFVGSVEFGRLFSISAAGGENWMVNMSPDGPGLGVAVADNGTVYTAGRIVNAFDSTGTNLWSQGGPVFGGLPVIGNGGILYVGEAGSHTLYAISPDGQILWHVLESASIAPVTAPAVDAGGTIHYCFSNSVVALSPQGQVQWTVFGGFSFNGFVLAATSPVIGPDGTLYAAIGSKLYAIATGTNGPANSAWPMYQQNARHTGKVEKPALKQLKKRADANFEFQLYAQLGQTNVIETTTNLSNWTSLTSVVVTTVPQPVVDLTASNAPARHYRTLAP